MSFLVDSSIHIPVKYKNEYWFQSVLGNLSRKEQDYNGTIVVKNYFYKYKNVEYLIPRFSNVRKYGIQLDSAKCRGEPINIQSKIEPRNSKQKEAIDWICNNKNGVLCMNPGEGKTVVTIAGICKHQVKTIIFVHKNGLVTQWLDRICEMTNFNKEDVSILTSQSYQSDLEKPIVLSTVQTFCSMIDKFPNLLDIMKSANFGMAVWDECHTSVSAEKFSLSSLFTPTERVYGLSATPERNDGNTDIINLHLGTTYTPDSDEGSTLDPKIVLLKFDHEIMSQENLRKYVMFSGSFDKSRYLKQLCKSKKFLKMMQSVVRKSEEKYRNLLFLSDRIKILDEVSKGINNQDEVGFFIPRSKGERDSHLQRKFVFSTYGSSRDGTDKKELDFLVMSTPTSNLKQCIGRVRRSCEGKKQPIVLDVVDTGSQDMINRFEKRLEKYKNWNWEVVDGKVFN